MDYLDDYGFVRPYILNDEHILWRGKPEKGNVITGREVGVMLFSILWLSFTVFWEITAIKSGTLIMILWGLPFVGVGLYLSVGRLFRAAYLRNKTFYVITNKKIIVKCGKRITLHDGRDLPPMNVEIHRNGNGTILFCDEMYTRRGYVRHNLIMFENLADVAAAQNAISMMDN